MICFVTNDVNVWWDPGGDVVTRAMTPKVNREGKGKAFFIPLDGHLELPLPYNISPPLLSNWIPSLKFQDTLFKVAS